MALRALLAFVCLAAAFGEEVTEALAADDVCGEGQDCSLELHQLRGMKVDYLQALDDNSEDEEDEAVQVEEEAEIEGGACTNAADMKVWKSGGKRSFDAALNHCGRSCAAGFPCTKDPLSDGVLHATREEARRVTRVRSKSRGPGLCRVMVPS